MSVEALPTELVRDVCRHLDVRDWCAFRITCSAVYTKSLDPFAERYCKSIGFIVTSHGIDRLEQLAANDAFRSHVQELRIMPSLFEGYYEMDLDAFRTATFHPRQKKMKSVANVQAEYTAYQDLVADHLSIVESDTLSNTLKKCVARFDNLAVLRLEYGAGESGWRQMTHGNFWLMGWRAARDQLGYDPLALNVRRPIHNFLKTRAKDHAVAFSALLEALAATNRKIKGLETCNNAHCALSPSDVTLSQPRESLCSALEELEVLHLCTGIWEPQSDDSTFRGLVNLPIMAAPNLKVLTFSQWDLSGALAPQYFDDLSQRISFTRIEEIHLYWVEITFDAFKAFLHTARPTLRALSLESVNLRGISPSTNTDIGHQRDLRDYQEMIQEASAAWQQVFDFLRDECSLRSISLMSLGYRGYRLHMEDDLSKLSGSLEGNFWNFHSFNAERAGVSFKEWIAQLRPGPPRGPRGRFSDIPGRDNSAWLSLPASP